jgi:hypothetical protein
VGAHERFGLARSGIGRAGLGERFDAERFAFLAQRAVREVLSRCSSKRNAPLASPARKVRRISNTAELSPRSVLWLSVTLRLPRSASCPAARR